MVVSVGVDNSYGHPTDRMLDWLADAQRYAAARRGLERIEAAAILEPDDLRDGNGQPVSQQNSPTGP